MADYRSIQTRMWREDPWFQGLDTDGRLLWIYLITNPSASAAGIYRLTAPTMAFESGIAASRVQELLAQFSAANKAHYDSDRSIVWVVKMRMLQFPGKVNKKIEERIKRDLADIPECPIKDAYIGYYENADTLSIGHRYGIHRASATETETETKTETETERKTETETECAEYPIDTVDTERPPTNGPDPVFHSLALSQNFLNEIGFDDPTGFLRSVDDMLVAQWAWHYRCMTPAQRRSVKNWPALVNRRVRDGAAPRMSDAHKTAFYQQVHQED